MTEIDGLKMVVWEPDTKISRAIKEGEFWEPYVVEAIKKYSRPDWLFMDLGANIGQNTLVGARLNKHTISVEPHPLLFPILQQNVRLNGLDNVTTHRAAVSDHDGIAEMFILNEGNTGVSFVAPQGKHDARDVPALTLSTILGDQRPQFAKVDIEGSEHTAFKNEPDILGGIQVLITEWCESHLRRTSEVTGQEYYRLLRNAGFRLYFMEAEGEMTEDDLPTGGYTNILCFKED